ncbi:MAG: amylo-alpha-1,6-glucosidase, partial [Armatimonadota bacterium]
YDPGGDLSNRTDETGRIVGSLQVKLRLGPGEEKEVAFIVAFSPHGRGDAARIIDRYWDHRAVLNGTVEHYREALAVSDVTTPDVVVNQGGQWSKANMLRVLSDYPFSGTAFTNDPGNSSNVVARDLCWYVYGSDYLTPLDTCNLLYTMADLQEKSGKIIEYYNAVTGWTDDYGLNINDNTPLFILASAHHLRATGHRGCVERLYPAIVRAADYMISQMDDRGLVFCTSRETEERGIAGWRNIIPNKNISGAVTEVNSEAYAAFRAVAEIAGSIGKLRDKEYFTKHAEKLREAINEHLLNPKNGTYYLNIDPDGNAHTEVTADEVFPLLFGVGDEETSRLISTRLSSPDFMTRAGLRTVPAQDPLYISDRLIGLEGGVWPGVTWWYAMASATTDPSLMVNALRSSYRHYIENPGAHNTVPGQFSEWFDGQSLVNRGMRLSPWEPPRFLWALVEGAVGLRVGLEGLSINPRIPPEWHWLILENLPYHNETISFFMTREDGGLRFYTTNDFESEHPVERYESDLSNKVRSLSGDMHTVAMGRGMEVLICLASTATEKQTAAFSTEGLFTRSCEYSVTVYSSETGDHAEIGRYFGERLERLSAWIEPGGFSLLSVYPA